MSDPPESFDVSISVHASREPHLVIAARITSGEEWHAFCETINSAAGQVWPQCVGDPDKPARRTRRVLEGYPRLGTFDADVLAFARKCLADKGALPSAEDVADAFDRVTLMGSMAIGRLKKRGVWPQEGGQ